MQWTAEQAVEMAHGLSLVNIAERLEENRDLNRAALSPLEIKCLSEASKLNNIFNHLDQNSCITSPGLRFVAMQNPATQEWELYEHITGAHRLNKGEKGFKSGRFLKHDPEVVREVFTDLLNRGEEFGLTESDAQSLIELRQADDVIHAIFKDAKVWNRYGNGATFIRMLARQPHWLADAYNLLDRPPNINIVDACAGNTFTQNDLTQGFRALTSQTNLQVAHIPDYLEGADAVLDERMAFYGLNRQDIQTHITVGHSMGGAVAMVMRDAQEPLNNHCQNRGYMAEMFRPLPTLQHYLHQPSDVPHPNLAPPITPEHWDDLISDNIVINAQNPHTHTPSVLLLGTQKQPAQQDRRFTISMHENPVELHSSYTMVSTLNRAITQACNDERPFDDAFTDTVQPAPQLALNGQTCANTLQGHFL